MCMEGRAAVSSTQRLIVYSFFHDNNIFWVYCFQVAAVVSLHCIASAINTRRILIMNFSLGPITEVKYQNL